MSDARYELRLTREALRVYESVDAVLLKKLHRCFDILRQDPYTHPNSKRLTGVLSGYWRYRVGDWRVVYQVQEEPQQVIIITIAHRSQVYR